MAASKTLTDEQKQIRQNVAANILCAHIGRQHHSIDIDTKMMQNMSALAYKMADIFLAEKHVPS